MHGWLQIHSSALASAIQSDLSLLLWRITNSELLTSDFCWTGYLTIQIKKANIGWVYKISVTLFITTDETLHSFAVSTLVFSDDGVTPSIPNAYNPPLWCWTQFECYKVCGPPLFCNRKIGALSKRWGQNTMRALMTFLWMSDLFLIWLDNLYWNAEANQILLGSKPGHRIDWYPRP